MTYTPRVLTAPAEPGTVRKVGALEIPASRTERIGPDPLPPLDVELLDLKRTPDGRLLCYRQNGKPTPGTGCAGCKWSESKFCVNRFDAAYRVKDEAREKLRAKWRVYQRKRQAARSEAMSPEEREAIRAKWRAQWRAKGKRGREARNAARLAAKALLSTKPVDRTEPA